MGPGPVFPQALKILEGFDLRAMGHNSVAYVHTVNQALNLALLTVSNTLVIPLRGCAHARAAGSVPVRERRKLIDPQRLAGHASRR